MSGAPAAAASLWADAALAAALVAIDPAGLGGANLRALPGPVRDRWLGLLCELLPASVPPRRVPPQVDADRLLGGIDLGATLAAGRPIIQRGLLAEVDAMLLLAMAERMESTSAALIAGALDCGEFRLERDGFGQTVACRFGVIALDEGLADDERPPGSLRDRLAFHLDLGPIGIRDALAPSHDPDAIDAARARLPAIEADEACTEALCAAGLQLGIGSIRAPLLALRAARAAAALAGRRKVSDEDLAVAGRLVLAPRATMLSAQDDQPEAPAEPPDPSDGRERTDDDRPLEDQVVAAAQAAMPAGLLAQLQLGQDRGRIHTPGRAGALSQAARRGRPVGVRRGAPRAGARLDLLATLRAAAPWQPLRKGIGDPGRIQVRPDDFRVRRFKQRTQTTTVFAVDASGSSALHRLAEAKGAVELVLADCYVRRDQVALLAFRGAKSELLLPPTRSLVRAKRSLASLPGGGGTPLAAGIDAAAMLADTIRRRGDTPIVMLLTDGRANVARDGSGGREQATIDAIAAAQRLRAAGLRAILVDTSPRPQLAAEHLAAAMNALYLPLPYADARALSGAVQAANAKGRLAS